MIYGDMLLYFSELMRSIAVFSMLPKVSGGYNQREKVATIQGYITRNKNGAIGTPDDNLNDNQLAYMYTKTKLEEEKIQKGLFVEYYNDLYRLVTSNVFIDEGGFVEYKLQLVVGVTDESVPVSNTPILNDF